MNAADRVVVDVDGAVAHVRLNRPDKLNALDRAMFTALVQAGRELISNSAIRAVVLSGNGRAFCAGLDYEQFARMAGGASHGSDVLVISDERLGGARALGQQAVRVWSQVRVPVIAAVHGVALGGGLQIALGADLRIVSPGAELSVMEIRWGLIPDMGGTQLLPELVGRDVAKLLTFTGRSVSGTVAAAMGLASEVADDPVAAALGLAHKIAEHDPAALMHAKALLDMAGRVSLELGLDAEQEAIAELIASPALASTVKARLSARRATRKEQHK